MSVPTCRLGRPLAVALFSLLITLSQSVTGQPSLSAAVEAAYANHPSRAPADSERSLGQAYQQRASRLLAGDPTFNVKYQTDAIGSDLGYREWEGGVDLPLRWVGQSGAQRSEAERTLRVASDLEATAQLDVAGEVRIRLWEWALARGAQEDAYLAEQSAIELQRDIGRRVAAGELAESDLLLARQEALIRQDERQQADNLLSQAKNRLLEYIKLDTPPEPDTEPLVAGDAISEQHPALSLAHSNLAKARAQRDRVASERRSGTHLWLGGKTTRSVSGADYDSAVGIELAVPLGSHAYAAPALAEAEAAVTAAQVELANTRRQLDEELRTAQLDYQRAVNAERQADGLQQLAQEGLRLNQRAFELGETDLVRLLRARNDALSARHLLETRRLQVAQAVARLNQAFGVLPQ